MSRFFLATFIIAVFGASLVAQSSAPTSSPQTTSKSPAQPTPSPSATPTLEDLVNSLGPTDLQAFITLLKANFTDPDAAPGAFYSEVINGRTGYVRLGTLNNANLQSLDKALSSFAAKKVNDLIVDLRASPATSDLPLAAEFAKRFSLKGKPIFT